MFYPFKKIFLLLLVVLPCFFAEAADRFQAILDARVDIKPYLKEIEFNTKETCRKLDISEMKRALDYIYDIGKKEIETKGIDIDENRLLKSVFITLWWPEYIFMLEANYHTSCFEPLCNYFDFEKEMNDTARSHYSHLLVDFNEKGGQKELLDKKIFKIKE